MKMLHEELTERILSAAVDVHKRLGPALSESSYHAAMAIAMTKRGLTFEHEPQLPVFYEDVKVGVHIPDFVVENKVIVELKVAKGFEPVFTTQVLTYLRLSRLQVGLLINFNVEALKFGIKRIVK